MTQESDNTGASLSRRRMLGLVGAVAAGAGYASLQAGARSESRDVLATGPVGSSSDPVDLKASGILRVSGTLEVPNAPDATPVVATPVSGSQIGTSSDRADVDADDAVAEQHRLPRATTAPGGQNEIIYRTDKD